MELNKINKELGYRWTQHLTNREIVPVGEYTWAKETPKMIYRKLDEMCVIFRYPDFITFIAVLTLEIEHMM